ncbi:pyrimidine dimer DNA glycosylase/endonuclease V [Ornithinicoccus halotolerans]|uniref:pyrimidine dimer DNA glycosylase/endonuclease V n=1 Tax=Ornithinicoccus halotolerans TaxID=1748220 RepID=UPI0012974B6C|nr:pyrimidine dimer DNA glycosylase/endonuclease V [Ornithinicoccus halotolerans]
MRLWSLHPRYLDRQGLTAGWREALLAQAVLAGRTRGYTRHPQLERFRAAPDPMAAVGCYLVGVWQEATARGYRYDLGRVLRVVEPGGSGVLEVTAGQLGFEWSRLRGKLAERSPAVLARWEEVEVPDPHPLFAVVPGPVAPWERAASAR